MELTDLSTILKENGIVGAGGAGFPSYAKLSPKAEVVLLNCAECEPLLELHKQLLQQCTTDVLDAFELVRETVGAKEGKICIKAHYESTIAAIEGVLPKYPHLSICKLDSIYPAGDEVVTAYCATGKVVRPGGLPIEIGVIVYNVETMYNAYHAVKEGKPVTSKLITVSGDVKTPKTVRVPLGVTLQEVVALAGGPTIENYTYWVGGPMMGFEQKPTDLVKKNTNSIFIFPKDHYLLRRAHSDVTIEAARAAASCCQCQMCTDLCPRHNLGHPIQPHLIMRATACGHINNPTDFTNAFYCCACGVCENYACPQGLSPRKIIQKVKAGLRAAGVKPSPDVTAASVNPMRDLRQVPIDRLIARLGVTEYELAAPLDNEEVTGFKTVRVLLSQHIGAPAKAVVAAGDTVKKGQAIAEAAQGLSVNIHASIDGLVTEVTDRYIEIKAKA